MDRIRYRNLRTQYQPALAETKQNVPQVNRPLPSGKGFEDCDRLPGTSPALD